MFFWYFYGLLLITDLNLVFIAVDSLQLDFTSSFVQFLLLKITLVRVALTFLMDLAEFVDVSDVSTH